MYHGHDHSTTGELSYRKELRDFRGGRWVADFHRNGWPVWTGIRTLGKYDRISASIQDVVH